MNLIVLSRMYPRSYNLQIGTFVEEQVQALNRIVKGDIIVISPVPWSPRLLWFKKKWREYGQVEREKIEKGIKVYHPRYLVIPGSIFCVFQVFLMYLSVRSLIKKLAKTNKGRTVLHSHTIFPEGLAVALLKRKLMIPHICTIHGGDINFFPFRNKLNYLVTKYALKKCDYLVTVSDKLRSKTRLIANGLNNVSVIHNGADCKKFKPIPKEIAKQKLGIKESCEIILFIGHLEPVKGVDYLLKAFAMLQRDRRDTRLFLVGDGYEKDKLMLLSKNLKIDNQVCFMGRKPFEEIPLWLNIADVFVLPSISEGFPTVIPEAMMCGVPVIASDVGGIPEIIINDKTGILTKPGNVELIEKGIKLLLDNKRIRNMISETAKEQSKKYSWKNNASGYIAIYKKVFKDFYGN